MNVFDFDKTVYLHESSTGFYRFVAVRRPVLLLWLPVAAWYGLGKLLGLCDTRRVKEAFHGYLRVLPDAEAWVERYWDRHQDEIPGWLQALLPQGGFVISASPEFLIGGLCRRLGLDYCGTRMDLHTGHITGENCKGAEKPRRFRARFPNTAIDAFYSDDLVDTPMAKLAREAWLVKGEALSPWPR